MYLENYKKGFNSYIKKIASINKEADRALYEVVSDYTFSIPAAIINNLKATYAFKAAKKTYNPIKKIELISKALKHKKAATFHKNNADDMLKYFSYAGSIGGAVAAVKALQVGMQNKKDTQKLNDRIELSSQGIKTYY